MLPVRRQEGKVWIDGIDHLAGWARGEENTYIGSLKTVLSALGEDVTYERLMGVSGAAFRLHIARPTWCPSAPDATVGFDCSVPALKALGYRQAVTHAFECDLKPERAKEILATIFSLIDKGKPILAINLNGQMDWGVLTGYHREEKYFLCRTYDTVAGGYERAKAWPCIFAVLDQAGPAPQWRSSVLESLGIAASLAVTVSYENYASGYAAYEAWMADLRDETRFENQSAEDLGVLLHANAWCYCSLQDARQAAARYLNEIEGVFTPESKDELAAARDAYARMAATLKENQALAPFPRQLKEKSWTSEMRQAQVEVLSRVLELEKEAMGRLEQVSAANSG